MGYRGTPYYDMARDAGCRHGEEAEAMAAQIEESERRRAAQLWADREREEEAERARIEEENKST